MAKKVVGLIKLQVPAGKANPSPPIGPALGQRGLNIGVCKASRPDAENGAGRVPVVTPRTRQELQIRDETPPASCDSPAAKIEKGSSVPFRKVADHPRPSRRDSERRCYLTAAASRRPAHIAGSERSRAGWRPVKWLPNA